MTVRLPDTTVGIATCYDLRFPELFRGLVDAGAEMFVLSAGWPERRRSHWTLLARARAVENQAYVLACGTAGTHAGVLQAGHSIVVDPWGEVLAEAGADEEVLTVEFDPAADKTRLLRCGAVSPVPALPPGKALVREEKSTFGIALVLRDGWLWTFGGSTVRRLSLAGKHEEFPFLGRAMPVLWGQGPAYMTEVGADAMLAGGNEGFALLTFPGGKAAAARQK